ncbi:MAG: hypothetical protein U5K37_13460 [Natrialbaceae archaeon]|nr:hypothetical protein [Natrialbaceae archaeon]
MALLEIRRSLQRHPAVKLASGHPPGQFTRVQADVDPRVVGGACEMGSLIVRWYAGESVEARPEFAFHYSDGSGFDCGWHHEPNPHVDGWGHYQERPSRNEEYVYEPITFESEVPVRVCWEVMDRLRERLEDL